MLLTVAAAASWSCSSHPLLSPVRTNGGAPAPPRTGAAKSRALTTPLQRSSSFTFGCACSSTPTPGDKDRDIDLFDEYSVLSADIPWETEDIWRTFAGYLLILHIPLSFGGLDAVAKGLHCSSIDPLTTVVSTAMLQLGELTLGLALLQYSAKPRHQVQTFFSGKFSSRHSWIKESVLWFGLLMSMVFITSLIADILVGPEVSTIITLKLQSNCCTHFPLLDIASLSLVEVSNLLFIQFELLQDAYDPILKEILSDSPTSRLVCFFLYCVIAPLSEETIYRGFLLTALSSSMRRRNAIIVSSLMFSVAHLSVQSFFQLFIIGCITGLAYCRTGTLAASFTIHSLYNAVILFTTIMS
uniref:Uncharacterized protein n=1 Tax=Avena sativa TaxID=4498 RepID=A0ACD5V6Q5_AVESA